MLLPRFCPWSSIVGYKCCSRRLELRNGTAFQAGGVVRMVASAFDTRWRNGGSMVKSREFLPNYYQVARMAITAPPFYNVFLFSPSIGRVLINRWRWWRSIKICVFFCFFFPFKMTTPLKFWGGGGDFLGGGWFFWYQIRFVMSIYMLLIYIYIL